MKVCLVGDPHGDWNELLPYTIAVPEDPTWRVDVIIVLGDAQASIYAEDLLELTKHGTQIGIIEGNHDIDIDYYSLPIEKHWGGDVGILDTNIFHLRRSTVYTIGTKKFLTIGGAISEPSDTGYPIDFEDTERAIRVASNAGGVDYVLSHDGPLQALPKEYRYTGKKPFIGDTSSRLEIVARHIEFSQWFFGHYHESWKCKRFTALSKLDVFMLEC